MKVEKFESSDVYFYSDSWYSNGILKGYLHGECTARIRLVYMLSGNDGSRRRTPVRIFPGRALQWL